MLSEQQVNHFIRFGYVILPQAASATQVKHLRTVTEEQLQQRQEPFELEADVRYPGAPDSAQAPGGQTIRRLQQAYARHDSYQSWANSPSVTEAVQQLLGAEQLYLTPNNHNCIMTKQPRFSSQTNWHRDTRYWHYSNKYLINSWLALQDETAENGGMLILPGSHRWDLAPDALDADQFLIADHPSNQARLTLAKQVDLNAGDCLLFSAHCFHAAGKNDTDQRKFSMIFTYHGEATQSLPNTRSSLRPSIQIT